MRRFTHISNFDKDIRTATPIVATIASIVFNLSFLQSTLLFYGVPSIYLSIRNPRLVKTTLIFSLIMGLTMLFIFDHMAYMDHSWFVPNSRWRFLDNSIPIEDGPWAVLLVYISVITWEYFFQKPQKDPSFHKNINYFVVFCATLLTLFFIAYIFSPQRLVIPYFYIKMGIVFEIIPLVIFIFYRPAIFKRLLKLTIYFFLVSALAEFIGLRNYQWYFEGKHYIGETLYFGHRLPWDEVLNYWLLATPGTVAWYEFFASKRTA